VGHAPIDWDLCLIRLFAPRVTVESAVVARRFIGVLILLASSSTGVLTHGGLAHAASPSPPAVVVAQGLTGTTVELIWTAAGGSSYNIYRAGTLLTNTAATSYTDTGLTPLTSYEYQVSTVAAGIEGALSAAAATTTQAAAETSPPTEPGAIIVSSITSSSAKLSWSKSSDNAKVEGYRVLRGVPGDSPASLPYIWTVDGFLSSYTATALRSGKSYQFGIQALDPDNNLSPIRTVTFTTTASSDTEPPVPPSSGSLSIKKFSPTRIDLTWGASTSSDVSGYLVLRNGVVVGQVDLPMRTTYSDNGLSPSTTYSYAIEAVDRAGNVSIPSGVKSGTTLAAGQLRIARGPLAQSTTAVSARITWWTDLPSRSVVAYGEGSITTTLIDPVLTTRHVMLIGPLTAGTTYVYQVGDGSVVSQLASVTTPALPGNTFSFAAIGDFGGNSPGELQNAQHINADTTQFIQTVGDNIYPDGRDPDFLTFYSDFDNRLFKQFQPAFMHETFISANGEKEYFGDRAFWRDFSLPNNEQWFSYDWGSAHILVLDTERPYTPGSPQYNFAQADLNAHQSSTWRIVVFQNPPYSSTSANSSSVPVQQNLVPLLQQQNVQLVLSGNSHNYERTYPLIDGQPALNGITYLVTGAGGNSFNKFTIAQPSWSAFREDTTYEYVRVTVSATSLLVQAISASDGSVLDASSIPAS
jgi:chitodextrinase